MSRTAAVRAARAPARRRRSPSTATSTITSRACCARGRATRSRCSTARAARSRRASCGSGAPRPSWWPSARVGAARRCRGRARARATPLVLLTAVPRGGRMDFLVQKSCELGVSRIVPGRRRALGRASRAGAARALGEDRARGGPAVRAGRRPGRRRARRRSATALAAPELPERRLVLWHRRGRAGRCARCCADRAPTALLVGPEGGFTAAEIEAARGGRLRPGEPGSAHPPRRDRRHRRGRAGRRGLRRAISQQRG